MADKLPPLPALEAGPRAFQAIVIAKAIKLKVQNGITMNPLYTREAMARTAGNITGRTYTKSDKGLQQAQLDLEEMVRVSQESVAP